MWWIVIWTNLFKVHNQSSIVFAVNFEHTQAIIQHIDLVFFIAFPADIYLFKVNITNTRKRCKIHSELTIKVTERHWSRSGFFIVNFEHISYLFVVSIVSLENLFACWVNKYLPAGLENVWNLLSVRSSKK